MNVKPQKAYPNARPCPGFTLLESVVGMSALGVVLISLYTGMTTGFNVVRLARENLRATQVLQEKFETLRLYNWAEITSTNFIPSTFTAPVYSTGSTNASFVYQGTVTITNAGLSEPYNDDLRKVTVQITWSSGNLPRTRSMTSFVARYGLQNYIY